MKNWINTLILLNYIEMHYGKRRGNKSAFARDNGVTPQQVNDWINRGLEVIDGKLMQPKGTINQSSST